MALENIAFFYGSVEEAYLEKIKAELASKRVSFFPLRDIQTIAHSHFTHFMVCGTYEEIKTLLQCTSVEGKSVGIVPKPEQKALMRTLALPSDLKEALNIASTPAQAKIDLLYANGQIVLQEVVIGDVPPLDRYDTITQKSGIWGKLKLFWHTLTEVKSLHHKHFTLKEGNEKSLRFSAVGLVGLAYHNGTFAARLISDRIHAVDGKLSLLILAPTSIVHYMGYLARTLFGTSKNRSLPKSLGYVRGELLTIETQEPVGVSIDGSEAFQTPVTLHVAHQAVALSVGEAFWKKQPEEIKGKNSTRIDHLPSDEESAAYFAKSIPLFPHASQAQYSTLFGALREEAKFTSVFATLLVLATMIATLGLFINSASVIIGAMLLAPLMQPIVSLSMGVLRQDALLEITAFKTIALGVALVLFTAMSIAWLTPIEQLTSEMSGRLSVTLLDLFVAIVSGVAAAYAKSNEKIISSLAGVAIAVALVPPIAVAGIGLGWGVWHIFSAALLLFLTNLVGIVLAAALTFMVLGYSPLHIAKKGVATWFAIALLLSVPLYHSFEKMRHHAAIQQALSHKQITLQSHTVTLSHIEPIEQENGLEIRCEVIADGILTTKEKQILKSKIEAVAGEGSRVVATFRYLL